MNARLIAFGAFVAAVVAGPFLPAARQADVAQAVLLLVAAIALGIAVGPGGQPSLGQGAFVGAGAYAAAIARDHGWDPISAIMVAGLIAGVAGAIVARGTSRLRPAFVAVVTWLVAWMFSLALQAFPSVFGGDAGLVVSPARVKLRALGVRATLGGAWWYEVALALLAACVLLAFAGLRRFGPALALARTDPAAARAAGIDVERLRRGVLIASAVAGGMAGAVLVHVIGVADPTTYGPLLSVKLFVVVLLGGAETIAGPAAGLVALLVISKVANVFAGAVGVTGGQVEPLVAGAALLGVLATGGGIVPAIARVMRTRELLSRPKREPRRPQMTHDGATLAADDVRVAFGGVVALDGVTLDVAKGEIHALVGPNGSGKSTLLRVLAGAVAPERGEVLLNGRAITAMSMQDRAAAGLARTLQRNAVPAGVTVRDQVVAGLETRRDPSVLRALFATPQGRAAHAAAEARATEVLTALGLDAIAAEPAERLSGFEQRLVQIARAVAPHPRMLLLDEPAAGLGATEEAELRDVIAGLASGGLTILLVEHNLRLVRALANRVTVLDAGIVIATGAPDQVANDPAVRAAYLGDDERMKART